MLAILPSGTTTLLYLPTFMSELMINIFIFILLCNKESIQYLIALDGEVSLAFFSMTVPERVFVH